MGSIVTLENEWLRVEVAPEIGGRIVSLIWRESGEELLWRNAALPLQRSAPDSPYDPNFYGGIDELLPCDLPETIDGIACPDHGELWTLPLSSAVESGALMLRGTLPRFGLAYERRMALRPESAEIRFDYRIRNPTANPRHFLWKLHAALAVRPGDIIECPARWARPVDPEWTTCKSLAPFPWPWAGDRDKSSIPAEDGTVEFLYLYDLAEGRIGWRSQARRLALTYTFDRAVFPYAWLFQSFGGFDGHYTTILEPCTAMPLSVNEAAPLGQCSRLKPGEAIETSVSLSVQRLAGNHESERRSGV